MSAESRGGDLFIVDNSISGWTGLRYLEEWCEIAERFDIASGYFEIGSLLELDGKWQKLDKIRILMGDEMTHGTKKALLEAVKAKVTAGLDASLESDKGANPFLDGVPAVVEALKSGQIECRVYNKDKFHAKAYITHAKLDVVGARALVGSSNFTRPGLTENVELNVQVQSGQEVAELQDWFEHHWNEATEVTDDVLKVIERHARLYTPFEVYTKALQEFFRGHEITATEWEDVHSKMFPHLDRYQQEAYWALVKIARQQGGAFLCDGVGLGKTFVGLMLIERLIAHEGKRVVLFAPKGAKEAVWEPHLREWLPNIGGGVDFSNLAVFSHTDLNRKGDFPERFRRVAEFADAVVIDEAHHFRNPGKQGDPLTWEDRSRYWRLFDVLDPEVRPKSLYMLTATPVNNRLADFRHMAELFTRRDEAYFARTLGVNNLTAHFNVMERALRDVLDGDGFDITENLMEAHEILARDETFRSLVVQRSRAYAKESQIRETGSSVVFPDRRAPQVAGYSIRKTYGRLLDIFERAFERERPLFTLPIYYPLAYYKGDDESIDPFEENRQKQVVGLIRTNFLKRFESSVYAFEISCDRLLRKLLAFVEVHSITESEKRRLERWKQQNAEILNYAQQQRFMLWDADEPEDDLEDDVVPAELLEAVEELSREEYDVVEIIQETFLDMDQIAAFLAEARKFKPEHDDKLKKLKRLLKSRDLVGRKVLIFTEYADTARYLKEYVQEDGIEGVAQVDSGTKGDRADIIRRFSPYYNGTTSPELVDGGKDEIRILISTDVLSEGLNLQDATRMINYDIHWNPVRLMQRIGRVDRRMSPAVEQQLVADHPEWAVDRGKVSYWNFLPPDELNAILSLYSKVTHKTLMISKTLGIEGKKLLTPEDDYEALKEFNHAYEGDRSVTENMHLDYQDLLDEIPDLGGLLDSIPGAIFSGRKRPARGTRGVFFCYGLSALDKELGVFTEEAGTTRWYLYSLEGGKILEEPAEIISSIKSKPNTSRKCTTEEGTLVEIRTKVLKHIRNTYLKRVDAPLDAPAPALKCWMELNEG